MAETIEEYRNRINQLKTSIENEPYIEKMRDNIAEGISKTGNRQADIEVRQGALEEDFVKVQQDASSVSPTGAEVAVARGEYSTLDGRLTAEQNKVNAQMAETKPLVEFLFEQNGGIVGDPSPETAHANTLALRALMQKGYELGGANIILPAGIMYFSKFNDDEIIYPRDGVSVIGKGEEISILKCIEETSYTGGYSFFRRLSPLHNVNYRDFTVDMYDQDMTVYNSAGKAFYLQVVINSTFRDLKLKGTPSTALGIDFLVNTVIDNVHAYECGRLWGVIPKENNEAAPMFDLMNPPTHHAFPGGAGIGIGTGGTAGENFKIVNCIAEKCGHYGIFVEHQHIYSGESDPAIDSIISNNICRNNRFSGMGIRGGNRVQITGNQSYGNGSFGLSIDSMGNLAEIVTLRDALVANNIISENGLDGVHVDAYCNISGLDLKNNTIVDNGGYGIALGRFNYASLTEYVLQESIHAVGNTMRNNKKGNEYVKTERVLPIIDLIMDNIKIESSSEARNNVITDSANASIKYTGGWRDVADPGAHNGSLKLSSASASGDEASFSFNGTGFKFIASKHVNRGIATITIDDGTPIEINMYATDKQDKKVLYQVSSLPKGEHKVVIKQTDKKHPDSSGYIINIDAVYIIGGSISHDVQAFEENDSRIGYLGTWANTTGSHLTNGTARYTNSDGAKVVFVFKGSGFQFITATGTGRGIAVVVLDGKEYEVDLYSSETVNAKVVFEKKNLDGLEHKVEIRYTGRHRVESSAATLSIDQIKIFDGTIV